MGRPVTFLEGLSAHALSLGSASFEVRLEDGRHQVIGSADGVDMLFGDYESGGFEARELLADLIGFAQKPRRSVLSGQICIIKVQVPDAADGTFNVVIEAVPKADPDIPPRFTAKQGQYLAFIYNYAKIHHVAPAEADLQHHFGVSAPSVHEMIKTLERNGLIDKTPGLARSVRLLVQPDHLPRLR